MNQTMCAPARASKLGWATDHDLGWATNHDYAGDDRFPTRPIAVDRHRMAPDLSGRVSRREPARGAGGATPWAILVVAVAVAAIIGTLTHPSWPAPSWITSDPLSASRGAVDDADGVVAAGVTVFDDDVPAVFRIEPALLVALRHAANDASHDGVTFVVNSGWRSRDYQEELLREAISTYGSRQQAARWVATPDTSPHVSGQAADIGHAGAAWLSQHGSSYGLCQIYRNEPWHFELRPRAVGRGCPPRYPDPTHDPRMQQ